MIVRDQYSEPVKHGPGSSAMPAKPSGYETILTRAFYSIPDSDGAGSKCPVFSLPAIGLNALQMIPRCRVLSLDIVFVPKRFVGLMVLRLGLRYAGSNN
jgi:hypothetical protein